MFCWLGLLATTALSIKNLGHVFKVEDRIPSTHPSSCNLYYDPRHAANTGSTKPLSRIWDPLNYMSKHATFDAVNFLLVLIRAFHLDDHIAQAVSSAQYNPPTGHKKALVHSLQLNRVSNQMVQRAMSIQVMYLMSRRAHIERSYERSEASSMILGSSKPHTRTLTWLTDNCKIFRNLINTAAPDTHELKSKLFCDSMFMNI